MKLVKSCKSRRDDLNTLFKEVFDVENAYVIYDFERVSCRNIIMDYLNKNGIFSIGRYGSWEYLGMEEALAQGKEAILKKTLAT